MSDMKGHKVSNINPTENVISKFNISTDLIASNLDLNNWLRQRF